MAILGGGIGGAGNPVGGSFTGPAEALEIVGNFAYAYPSLIEATTSEQTVLSFTTGNYLFVGTFQLNGAVQLSNRSIVQSAANIKLNGVQIALLMTGDGSEDAPFSQAQDLIIPSYTEVEITVISDADDADNFATVGMTGRIYRE